MCVLVLLCLDVYLSYVYIESIDIYTGTRGTDCMATGARSTEQLPLALSKQNVQRPGRLPAKAPTPPACRVGRSSGQRGPLGHGYVLRYSG